MKDAFLHQRFTQSLGEFSLRLDDLLSEIRRQEAGLIPAELLDEVAGTLGELMLVLTEYKSSGRVRGFTERAASDTRSLREALRLGNFRPDQVSEAVSAIQEELSTVIHEDRQAA